MRKASQVHASDVDNDGYIDVIVMTNDGPFWYENDGSQSFIEHEYPYRFDVLTDIDHDNDLDSINYVSGGFGWIENDNNQNFIEHLIPDTIDVRRQTIVSVEDFDQDNDVDILIEALRSQNIYWYENDGSQNFAEHVIPINTANAKARYANDLDHDGDVDIIAESSIGMLWFENDGNHNYTEQLLIPHLEYSNYISALDFTKNGEIDFLMFNESGLVWYENDGNLNFSEHVLLFSNMIINVITGDIDSDGDLDFLQEWGDEISWFIHNQSPETISLNPINLQDKQPLGTILADLTTDDPNPNDSHTFTLVPGEGSRDNALFSIEGNKLFSNIMLDYETQDNFTIRVRVIDNSKSPLGIEQPVSFSISEGLEDGITPTPTPISTGIKDWSVYSEIKR